MKTPLTSGPSTSKNGFQWEICDYFVFSIFWNTSVLNLFGDESDMDFAQTLDFCCLLLNLKPPNYRKANYTMFGCELTNGFYTTKVLQYSPFFCDGFLVTVCRGFYLEYIFMSTRFFYCHPIILYPDL